MSRLILKITGITAVMLLVSVVLTGSIYAASPAEYQQMMSDTSDAVSRIRMDEMVYPGKGQAELDRLSNSLPSSISVESGRQRINVDLSWIKKDITSINKLKGKNRTKRVDQLYYKIINISSSTRMPAATSISDTGKAKVELAKILARREYQQSRFDSWGLRILRAISDMMSRLKVPAQVADTVYWIVVGGAILACVIALIYVIRIILNRQQAEGQTEQASTKKRIQKTLRPSLESLLEKAEQEASAGRYKEAFRCIYLATLILLDRARMITYTDSSTNWEYIRALRKQSQSEMAEVFQRMTRLFDESIYGHSEISGDDYKGSLAHYRDLESRV